LTGQAHFNGVHTQLSEHLDVFSKVALQSQDTDFHGQNYQPRPASFSDSGMLETFKPTMGSPRLRLTSARMAASR